MPYNKKEIKILGNGKGKTLVKVSGTRPLDNKIVFSFSFLMVKVYIIEILITFMLMNKIQKNQ